MESGLGGITFIIDGECKQVCAAAPKTEGAMLKEPRREGQSWAVGAGFTPYLGVNVEF